MVTELLGLVAVVTIGLAARLAALRANVEATLRLTAGAAGLTTAVAALGSADQLTMLRANAVVATLGPPTDAHGLGTAIRAEQLGKGTIVRVVCG